MTELLSSISKKNLIKHTILYFHYEKYIVLKSHSAFLLVLLVKCEGWE